MNLSYLTIILLIILLCVILFFSKQSNPKNKFLQLEHFDQNNLFKNANLNKSNKKRLSQTMIPASEALSIQIENYMTKYQIPAGQFCAIKDGQILYNQSFGLMSCNLKPKINNSVPKSKINNSVVFRIASCTKPITAIAILMLIEQNKLSLDDSAFNLLIQSGLINPKSIVDLRLHEITIRQLLRHEGGWDSNHLINGQSFDPQYDALRIASTKPCRLATAVEIIRYMATKKLDFNPGTKSVYSNFGYNVLGRIIEVITGQKYANYIIDHVFSKVGITNVYIGNEKISGPNEIIYCDGNVEFNYAPDCEILEKIPPSYGSFDLSVMDSHGGWVMSATDLAKFANGILQNKYLRSSTFNQIYQRPDYVQSTTNKFYSLGFNVEKQNQLTIISHQGALTFGTFSSVGILPDKNLAFAAIFNHLEFDQIPNMSNDLSQILINSFGI
jgi:N-acyl-D-amino-acid deacylase